MIQMMVQSNRLDLAHAMAAQATPWRVYAISDDAGMVVYVGSSTRVRQRYRDHVASKYNKGLRAWLAFSTHALEILGEYTTKREMLDAEIEYIATLRPCFNVVGLT